MNAIDLSCCQHCNSDISQSQRFCNNCGHRINHSNDKGSGTIKGTPCYNVINSRIKFCGSCGTKNDSYIPDTTIRKTTLISDNSFLSDHDSETEDKWVPHDIDSDIADDSSSNIDVTLNTSLNSANDVNQEDKWEPQTTEKGLSSKSDIQTVDNGRSSKSDIQTDKMVLSEQNGKQELGDTGISIENGNKEFFKSYAGSGSLR
ncbi:Hypothetical predicted protein [Mytilus galloprovincialis]|uniref:DZANK-type domain-containing protein n=1 Tax=Mytilus galloprovincialis TaxID=29158 RepID=A0A8B6E9T6_MYTGA|nr:Hypothetical predicted protein [Mytilus galloprovincialis]